LELEEDGGFLLASVVAGASTGFSRIGIGEDDGLFLADAVVGAFAGFSGTGVGATAGTSAMEPGGAERYCARR
jgi:hypothetical protein